MPRHIMVRGQSAESASQADMGKFYVANAPGSRFLHGFGETAFAWLVNWLKPEPDVRGNRSTESVKREYEDTGSEENCSRSDLIYCF
jgi:hypothetical protein